MDLDTRIDRLLRRLENRGFATDKAQIYANGVKEKMSQVDYALSRMQYLQTLEMYDATTRSSTTSLEVNSRINTSDQIGFYCDSIWDFLWSAIDIMSQLVNIVLGLRITEHRVYFTKVASILSTRYQGTTITARVLELQRSLALKQLKGYRHCSTHRRPVYIETRVITTTISGRASYRSLITEPVTQTVSRLLCDNPTRLVPKVGGREVISYCRRLRRQIDDKISRIINQL